MEEKGKKELTKKTANMNPLLYPDRKLKVPYDNLERIINEAEQGFIPQRGWMPTLWEASEILAPNIHLCYDFVIWLIETSKELETKEEKYVLDYLNMIVNDAIEYYDPEEDQPRKRKEPKKKKKTVITKRAGRKLLLEEKKDD